MTAGAVRLRAQPGVLGAAALLLASASAAMASGPSPEGAAVAPAAEQVVRVFEIRYRDVGDVSVLIEPHLSPNALLAVNKRTRTVKVIDRPDIVQQVADFIRQFDVPPRSAIVRIILEKAERVSASAGEEAFADPGSWSFEPLAETTLEVLERGRVTQAFGPDDAFEIHVELSTVDPERRLLHFEDFAVSRAMTLAPIGDDRPPAAARRELLRTALELQDRVPKVVMTARSESADVALVVRVLALLREPRDPEP